MKKQLVLASLEELLKKNCVNYSISSDIYSLKESSLENFKIKVNKSHWSKNSKKKIDYIYLKKLYYSTFKDLTKYLNEYHSINFSKKKWHLILGPWLNYAIPILWDRWETVDFSKKNLELSNLFLYHKIMKIILFHVTLMTLLINLKDRIGTLKYLKQLLTLKRVETQI